MKPPPPLGAAGPGFFPGAFQGASPAVSWYSTGCNWVFSFSGDLFPKGWWQLLQCYRRAASLPGLTRLCRIISQLLFVGKLLENPKHKTSCRARSCSFWPGLRMGIDVAFCLIPFTPCHKWFSTLSIPVSPRNLSSSWQEQCAPFTNSPR